MENILFIINAFFNVKSRQNTRKYVIKRNKTYVKSCKLLVLSNFINYVLAILYGVQANYNALLPFFKTQTKLTD